MKRRICVLLAVLACLSFIPFPALAAGYPDVPGDSWALSAIEKAAGYRLMEGVGGGKFGYGETVTRAQFVTIVCRMFGWEEVSPAAQSFADVAPGAWYYPYVETALLNGVFDAGGAFRPDEPILRGEMAVMLVRALGYGGIAESLSSSPLPFTDVTASRGYIAIAYDIGMTNGITPTEFGPSRTAKREEAATMLVRVYEKLVSKTEWYHGFYAFSSYPQRYVTDEMGAVSVGWSRLSYSAEKGAYLMTTSAGGNEYYIPSSYESIVSYLDGNGTKMNLLVFMDSAGGALKSVLLSESARAQAVDAIIGELEATYKTIGKNPYAGVTIDFEGLKGEEVKAGMNAFLRDLSGELEALGKSLYVAVQPVLDGEYFDGFDYRTIGELADKVILMAHDYNALSLAGFENTTYYRTTALTPINAVYRSLRAIADPETGVGDKSKIALAVSFSSLAWRTSDGKLVSPSPARPAVQTIYGRLKQADTVIGWSEEYRNPYATYRTEDGSEYFLWYEDSRSVAEKVRLARLFGITGVSVWRIGNIPDYPDEGLFYNALDALK